MPPVPTGTAGRGRAARRTTGPRVTRSSALPLAGPLLPRCRRRFIPSGAAVPPVPPPLPPPPDAPAVAATRSVPPPVAACTAARAGGASGRPSRLPVAPTDAACPSTGRAGAIHRSPPDPATRRTVAPPVDAPASELSSLPPVLQAAAAARATSVATRGGDCRAAEGPNLGATLHLAKGRSAGIAAVIVPIPERGRPRRPTKATGGRKAETARREGAGYRAIMVTTVTVALFVVAIFRRHPELQRQRVAERRATADGPPCGRRGCRGRGVTVWQTPLATAGGRQPQGAGKHATEGRAHRRHRQRRGSGGAPIGTGRSGPSCWLRAIKRTT